MSENAGYAVLQVIPSMRGTKRMLEAMLLGPAAPVGKSTGRAIGDGIGSGLGERMRSSGLGKMLSRALAVDANDAGTRIGRTIGSGIDSTLGAAVTAAGKGAVAKLVGSFAGAGVAVAGALAPAAGAILALPAAAGVAGVAIGVLAVGVSGLGDAMSAVADGDAEKLAEAMEGLSDGGREFVTSWRGIRSALQPVRDIVQDNLLGGLGAQLETLTARSVPGLETGMGTVATSLNGLAAEAVRAAGTPLFQGQMRDIFQGTADTADSFHGAVAPLMTVIAALVKVGLPLTARFGEWASGGLASAAAFLQTEEGAAQMAGTLDRAVDVIGQVLDISGNLSRGLAGIFGAAAGDGQSFLDTIESLTSRFAAWTNSAQGQEQLGTVFGALTDVATVLVEMLPHLATVLGTVSGVITSMSPETQATVASMLAWSIVLGPLLGRVGGLVSGLGVATTALGLVGRGVTGAVTATGRLIGGFRDARVAASAFSGRAGTIGGAIRTGMDTAVSATRTAATSIASSARSGWETLRLRAMYAGDAVRGAGQRALTAARGGIATATTAVRTAGTAALTSARHWTTLALAQTRSALAAGRARVATIAAAVAQRMIRVATVAWTGVQWLLNAALTANPIGLVVAGIALLIGAAVLAYNKVSWFRTAVDAAFAGIGAAASWLGQQATMLWQQYLAPAFTAIGNVVTWVFNSVILPVFRLYTAYIQNVIVPVVMWLWNTVIKPAFQGIGTVISWAWNNIIKPAFAAINGFISGTLGPVFNWLWTRVIKPAWAGIQAAINAAWTFVRDRIFSPMREGIARVGDAFDAGKEAIGKAWDGIKKAARAPVRFLVESVYNEGIVPMWNKVAGLVGADDLKTLSLPKGFARGGILPGTSTWRQGDDQLVPMRKGEGVAISEAMRVPALRGELLRWNAIGVRGGTSALRRYAGQSSQGFAQGGIFGGDTSSVRLPDVGSLLTDLATKGAQAFAGAGSWEDAINVVATPIRRALSTIGTSGLPGIPYMAVGSIRDKLVEWLDGNALGGGGGAPVGNTKGVPGRVLAIARGAVGQFPENPWGSNRNAITSWYGLHDQWCAMFVSWLFAQAGASGSLKRAKRTAWTGDYYSSGMQRVSSRQPGDVLVYGTRHVNLATGRRSTIGGNEGHNVRASSNYGGNPAIFRPAWAGMAKGGVVTSDMLSTSMLRRIGSQDDRRGSVLYDSGGWLQPGRTLVENRTGRPEAVYTAAQQERIDRMISVLERQGHRVREGHTFHIAGGDGRRIARQVVTALSDWERLHPVP
ncbi:phage tail protein [Nocardiopsis synnemataformans]|uniref:phage tail protein n=1 Tax=Nocardiopsis synnemataformans TaxID=61305 RepID=UPI003EBFF88B